MTMRELLVPRGAGTEAGRDMTTCVAQAAWCSGCWGAAPWSLGGQTGLVNQHFEPPKLCHGRSQSRIVPMAGSLPPPAA